MANLSRPANNITNILFAFILGQSNPDVDLSKENKAFLQISFIVGSFIFGYAPEIGKSSTVTRHMAMK